MEKRQIQEAAPRPLKEGLGPQRRVIRVQEARMGIPISVDQKGVGFGVGGRRAEGTRAATGRSGRWLRETLD